jgi:hypothetical protein
VSVSARAVGESGRPGHAVGGATGSLRRCLTWRGPAAWGMPRLGPRRSRRVRVLVPGTPCGPDGIHVDSSSQPT